MFIVGQEMENVNTDHINQEKITMASIRSGIGENMVEKPLYKSVPTMRNYEDYISECDYAKGWNDAMDFIFPEAKKEARKGKNKEKYVHNQINTERRKYGR